MAISAAERDDIKAMALYHYHQAKTNVACHLKKLYENNRALKAAARALDSGALRIVNGNGQGLLADRALEYDARL